MRKTLLQFQKRLSTVNQPQATFYLGQLARCIHSIRGKAQHQEETDSRTTILQMSSQQVKGELPFTRGCLILGYDQGYQSNLVSFLVDSGS